MYHKTVKAFLITMICVMARQPHPTQRTPIGQRLRELRGRRTQHEIAEAVGVRSASISLWESGAKPSRENAEAYDRALGAGGEVLSMFGYADATSGVTLTTIDGKLDQLLGLVRDLGSSSTSGRRRIEPSGGGDGTPSAMPRPVLRGRR